MDCAWIAPGLRLAVIPVLPRADAGLPWTLRSRNRTERVLTRGLVGCLLEQLGERSEAEVLEIGDSLRISLVLIHAATYQVGLRDPVGAASFAEEGMARARDHGPIGGETKSVAVRQIIGRASPSALLPGAGDDEPCISARFE